MSININLQELQNLNDINLSSVTQQFQTFNIELQQTADKKREVSKVFDGLGGAVSSVQGMLQNLGIELGSLPDRLMSAGTATLRLIGSMEKLGELKVMDDLREGFGKAKDGISNYVKAIKERFTQKETAIQSSTAATQALVPATQAAAGATQELGTSAVATTGGLKGLIAMLKASKIAMGLKTIALGVLKLALAATGLLAFTALLGLAIEGIRLLVNWFTRGSEAGNAFSKENERSAATIERLSESVNSNRQALDDNIRSIEATGRVNQGLIGDLQTMHQRYQDLNAQESISEASRSRIRNKVEQLNSSIEGLNLTIDEETGLLTESSQLLLEQAGLYNDVNAARARAEGILGRLNQAQAEHAEKAIEYERLQRRRISITENENLGWFEQRRLLREVDSQIGELSDSKGDLTTEIQDLGAMHADVYSDLYQNINTATEASVAFRAENERTAQAMDTLNGRIDANRQSHEDNIRSIEISNHRNQDLIGSLQELHEQGELDAAQRDRVRNKVEQLNESMEGLNLVIDEETGLLTESSQVLLEQTELYNDINTARAHADEILSRLNQAQEEAAEKGRELEMIDERRNRILADQNLENDERILLLAELNEEEQALIVTKEELSDEIENLGNTHDEVYTQMTYQIEEFTQATADGVAQQKLSFEDLSSAQQSVVNELNRTFNSHVDQLRGANGKIRVDNEFTANHWRETMEHNQLVMSEWADNVDSLAGRVSDEMLDYIRSLGPEHAHLVQDLVNMSGTELAEMEAVFKNNCQVAAQAALAGIDDAQIPMEVANLIFESERSMNDAIRDADFPSLGLDLAEGLRDGIKEGEHLVGTGAAALAREAEKAAREESETNSPSKVFYRIGEGLVTGLCQGIERLQPQTVTVMQTLIRNMKRVHNGVDREYNTMGRQLMTGLNQGLLNGEGQVMATANRIAQNIARTMQQALQINSPSRVMREQIGRHIPTGVAAGIEKYADVAIDSVYKLGHDLVKLNLPSVESMIGLKPSMRLAGVGGNASYVNHDHYSVSNKGLFDGATIHWHGEEDIRRTMEKIAWATEREKARMLTSYKITYLTHLSQPCDSSFRINELEFSFKNKKHLDTRYQFLLKRKCRTNFSTFPC